MVFKIHGMDCAEEVAVLKRELGPVVGVERLQFDVLNGKLRVAGYEGTARSIEDAVARTGMRAEPWVADRAPEQGLNWKWVLSGASGLLALLGFLLDAKPLYLAAIVCGGWTVFPRAWFAVRRMRPDMNLLMTIAVIGAIGIGEWSEAASVSFLFSLSLALESWSIGRARRAVEALLRVAPDTVEVSCGSGWHAKAVAEVEVGSRFRVKPGERIGLDGVVVNGRGEVNQAPITGESLPVSKEVGSAVFAGTINGPSALEVESTKEASDTTLAHVIRLVEEAQGKRSGAEQWVERFAFYYTPAVLALAVLTAVVPPLLFGGDWRDWGYQALVLLVIGCPCALVISTPVSVVAGLASAARNGVLIKSGMALEMAGRVKAIAFDKTGTLTEGRPVVVRVVPLNGHSEMELLQRALALQSASDHPLARAITEYARGRDVEAEPVEGYRILAGRGATGMFRGRPFWLGSHRYLEERGQETPEVHAMLERLSSEGHSVVVFGNEEHVCGFLTLADRLKAGVREELNALRAAGVEHLVMLTGDNAGTAHAIGGQTGVDEIHAELLPADKLRVMEELLAKYGQVAMAGDGVNDAPALARSSLGIAMGAAGSDTAMEAADVALMSDDISKVRWLVRHSRRTLGVIQQNIGLSLAVKLVFVGLAFLGHASLWMAIAADMGVSLLVIANGLRLLR